MMLPQPCIHGDLKATLDRSLELKAVLERMATDSHPETNAKAVARLTYMQKRMRKVKASLGFNEMQGLSLKKPGEIKTDRSIETALPKVRKRDGKKKLFKSLRDGHSRILATKAGRRLEGVDDPSQANVLHVINDLQLDTLELSTDRSFDLNSPRLPFISLTNGRTEDPIALPTFDEYAEATMQQGLSSPVEKAMKSVKRTMEHITNFKRKMDNLATLSRQPNPLYSSGRRPGLRRMTMPPAKLANLIQSALSNQYIARVLPSYEQIDQVGKEVSFTAVNSNLDSDRPNISHGINITQPKTPRRVRNMSSGDTKLSSNIESEETKLSQIVESITEERPTSIRRKQRLMSSDIEQLLATTTADKLLTEIRISAEAERQEKHRLNKHQAVMYRRLLEKLFNRKSPLNSVEIGVIEVVRRVIEVGELINVMCIQLIKRALKSNVTQAESLIKLIEQLALSDLE